MSNKLRADITGLRAIAVLAVTLFHISYVLSTEHTFFSGGFLGVDVFFVISGFLMTQIIMRGLQSKSFSLLEFYQRRAKRICPALFVVVAISLIISLFLLRSDFIHEGAKEALVSLGFISNFRFAKAVDYFDGGDFSHLFLHTWSLSVEWQFYIFYPVLLMLIVKTIGLKHIGKVLLLLTLIGFITAIVWTEVNQRQSYYLLPSRACELLAGSLAFYYPLENLFRINNRLGGGQLNKICEIIGVLFIIVSIFIIDNQQGWPTAWMLLPLFGSWLCIAANNQQSLLSNVVFQKLGLWSYAIYLVHWPVLVYVYALGFAEYSFLWLLPILLLGILLHILVERKRNYGYKFFIIYLCVVVLFASSEKLRIFKVIKSNSVESLEVFCGSLLPKEATIKIGDNAPSFILHGDSHTIELISILKYRGISFVANFQGGCYSIGEHYKENSDNYEPLKRCRNTYYESLAIANKYKDIPIVVIQNWTLYGLYEPREYKQNTNPFHIMDNPESIIPPSELHNFLYDDILKLAKDLPGRTIYIVGKKQENPYHGSGHTAYNNMLSVWARTNLTSSNSKFLTTKHYHYSINNVLKDAIERINRKRSDGGKYASLIYVDPDVYCSNGNCDLFINDSVQIYADRDHYSIAGSNKAVSNLLNVMKLDDTNITNDYIIRDMEQIRNITYSELEFIVDNNTGERKFILRD